MTAPTALGGRSSSILLDEGRPLLSPPGRLGASAATAVGKPTTLLPRECRGPPRHTNSRCSAPLAFPPLDAGGAFFVGGSARQRHEPDGGAERDHDVCACPGQQVPERCQRPIGSVLSRAEARMVPVCEDAGRPGAKELHSEPSPLARADLASADLRAVRVEHDDAPGSEAVRVPPVRGQSEDRPRGRCVTVAVPVVVIPQCGPDPGEKLRPRRVEASSELLSRAVLVDDVAEQRDRAPRPRDQPRDALVLGAGTGGDVSDGEQDGWSDRRRACRNRQSQGQADGEQDDETAADDQTRAGASRSSAIWIAFSAAPLRRLSHDR